MSAPAPAACPPTPDFVNEAALHARGIAHVAGVDEAGRGPLAGPVVAAAVILDPAAIPAGIDDSKRLTAHRRKEIFETILASSHVGIGIAPPARIDSMNIRGATLWAMSQALRALPRPAEFALIDGRDIPDGAPCRCSALVSGDARSLSIGAASIVAKVWRDRIMTGLDRCHPGYGFASHMGYATAEHRAALTRLGPTPHHRRSFAPVRLLMVETTTVVTDTVIAEETVIVGQVRRAKA